MANTTSIAFPNMLDPIKNRVSVMEDAPSVVNRTRLLMLTEPTELYMNPEFGVGLKKFIWQYNNANQKAMIKDRIISQLRMHEPCVNPEATQIADGLLFTGSPNADTEADYNSLKLTVGLSTVYGDNTEVVING